MLPNGCETRVAIGISWDVFLCRACRVLSSVRPVPVRACARGQHKARAAVSRAGGG